MKKILLILIFATLSHVSSLADCRVKALFNGHYKNKHDASQVVIKGNGLEEYDLRSFMSLTVSSPEDRDALAKAVEADGRQAKAKEVSYSHGKLVYAFLTLMPVQKTNRYVYFFRDEDKAVVMYLSGKATASQIEKMIKNSTDKKKSNKK